MVNIIKGCIIAAFLIIIQNLPANAAYDKHCKYFMELCGCRMELCEKRKFGLFRVRYIRLVFLDSGKSRIFKSNQEKEFQEIWDKTCEDYFNPDS